MKSQIVLQATTALAAAPTATIDSGPIIGLPTTLPFIPPVNQFLGIPYGQAERFALPSPPPRWHHPRNTTAFGPSCYQYIGNSAVSPPKELMNDLFHIDTTPQSEDCLSINVFAPSSPPPPGGRPILLFIPGGGFQSGNGIGDFAGIAGYEDIIVMSINYRTNVFGFLPNQNLGLHDQRLALSWIQRNAASFSGNPSRVTIWGESAGSLSVDIHINAYRQPPFRAAIMSSGQTSFGPLSLTSSSTTNWDNLAAAVGCNTTHQLSCMKHIPPETLIAAMDNTVVSFMPIVDNVTRISNPAAHWHSPSPKVPVMISTCAEEGKLLVPRTTTLPFFIQLYLSEPLVNQTQRDAIFAHYNRLYKTQWEVMAAIYTDFLWKCPQGILASAASSNTPIFRWEFNKTITPTLPSKYDWLGKFHGSDTLLLISSSTLNQTGMNAELYAFARNMRNSIGNFVRNPQAGPGWAPVGTFKPMDMAVLGDVGDVKASGTTPVNATEFDEVCGLYTDIYKLIEAQQSM